MAADEKPSLLDAMVDDHVAGITVDDVEAGRTGPDDEGPPAREAPPVDTQPRRWAADPDARICGLAVGGRLELFNGGPEVDGIWEVTALRRPLNAGPETQILVAARPAGGPPFLKITAADLAEDLACGNAVIRQADPRG